MFPDLGIDELATMGPEALQRAPFVPSHESRIAGYIGGEDRGKAARVSRGYRLARPFSPASDAAVNKSSR
jgi:hypothetical protein